MWSHIFLFGSPRRRPPEFTAILMFEFWREATATSVPGLLCQSGRRRPENVSILSSLFIKDGASTANKRDTKIQTTYVKARGGDGGGGGYSAIKKTVVLIEKF